MNEKCGFDSIITVEENRDLFDELSELAETPCFPVDDEELDPEAFILAVAAYCCLEETPEMMDIELFTDVSPLIHPDNATANYAIHWARRYIHAKIPLFTCKTIYGNIVKSLEDIALSFSGKESDFHNYFPNSMMLERFERVVSSFMTEYHKSKYYNNSFFAFAVSVYTSLRCNMTKKEAVSIMYQRIPTLDFAGCDRDWTNEEVCIIYDAILLVDNCLSDGFAKMFSPMTVIWHIILGLSRYYDGDDETEEADDEYVSDDDDDSDEDDLDFVDLDDFEEIDPEWEKYLSDIGY